MKNFCLTISLGACGGFIQRIFYKRPDHFNLQIRQNGLKKQSSAATTLLTAVTHNLQSRVFVSQTERFQTGLTKISATKGWSNQEVNAQIDKDLNP